MAKQQQSGAAIHLSAVRDQFGAIEIRDAKRSQGSSGGKASIAYKPSAVDIVSTEVQSRLKNRTDLYVRDTELVEVFIVKDKFRRGATYAKFRPVTRAILRGIVAETVTVFEIKNGSRITADSTDAVLVPVGPPNDLLDRIISHPTPDIRELREIVAHPTIDCAGRVILRSGYDAGLETFHHFPDIEPYLADVGSTREDAINAYTSLCSALPTFKHSTRSESYAKDLQLAQLLGFIAAPGMEFQTPIIAVTATERCSGKTTFAQVAHVLAFGRTASPPRLSEDSEKFGEEFSKHIDALCMMGKRAVLIDNVSETGRGFGGDDFAALTTSEGRSVREMGQNKRAEEHKADIALTVTGINFRIKEGSTLERRLLTVEMMHQPDKAQLPEDGQSRAIYTRFATPAIRGPILRDALTLLRAYSLEGQEAQAEGTPYPATFDSFDDWDKVVRRAILWVGGADILEANKVALTKYAEDVEVNIASVLAAWHTALADRFVFLAQLASEAQQHQPLLEALRELDPKTVVRDAGNHTKLSGLDPIRTGYALKKYVNRVQPIGGYRLHKKPGHSHKSMYSVECVEAAQSSTPQSSTEHLARMSAAELETLLAKLQADVADAQGALAAKKLETPATPY